MKEIAFSFIIFLCLCSNTQGQVEPHSLSLQISSSLNEGGNNNKSVYIGEKGGYGVDFGIVYGLTHSLTFQSGLGLKVLYYDRLLYKYEDKYDTSLYKSGTSQIYLAYRFNYFELPLHLNIVKDTGRIHFLISPGIIPAFLVRCEQYANGFGPVSKNEIEAYNNLPNVKDQFNSFSLLLDFGLGISYNISHRFSINSKLNVCYDLFNSELLGHRSYGSFSIGTSYRLR